MESNDKQNCYITFKRVMTINNTLIEDECFNWLNNFYFLNSNFVIGLDFGEFLFILHSIKQCYIFYNNCSDFIKHTQYIGRYIVKFL